MMTPYIKQRWQILKRTFHLFNDSNGLKLSAALSYYTVFSIGPMLIVIISLVGIFYGKPAVEGKVYNQIKGLTGPDAALQIQSIIGNIRKSNHGKIGSIIGTIILLLGASGVFSEIQSSINYLWSIPPPKKQSILHVVIKKLLSFSLLISLAFLSLVSLLVNAVTDLISEHLKQYFDDSVITLFYALNIIFILIIITLLFMLIFKILPNAVMRWKDALTGAFFTAVFFLIGKFLIGFYLGNSRIGLTYGATASIIVIMVWIYYSSIILYFGASFTRTYAEACGRKIQSRHETA